MFLIVILSNKLDLNQETRFTTHAWLILSNCFSSYSISALKNLDLKWPMFCVMVSVAIIKLLLAYNNGFKFFYSYAEVELM